MEKTTEQLYDEFITLARELGNRGYAMTVWAPEEIGTASIRYLEDTMVAAGSDFIADNQE